MLGKARYTYFIESDHARIQIIANLKIIKNVLIDLDKVELLKRDDIAISFKGNHVIYYAPHIKKKLLVYYLFGVDKTYVRYECKNGNMYDLRKENVIIKERLDPIDKTSDIKGISWHAVSSKWQARFVYRKKDYYIGTFSDKQVAIDALIQKRIEVLGQN